MIEYFLERVFMKIGGYWVNIRYPIISIFIEEENTSEINKALRELAASCGISWIVLGG
jgi:hypothetical protein